MALAAVTHSEAWKSAGFGGKARLLWDRAREWERGIVEGGRPDLGDGLAAPGHPVLDVVTRLVFCSSLSIYGVRLDPEVYAHRPFVAKMAENACRLLSPVL